MGDAAFRSRGASSPAVGATDVAEHYLPKASSLFGPGRMDGANQERAAASSQIQRSLKAWRKAKDDEPNYVPAKTVVHRKAEEGDSGPKDAEAKGDEAAAGPEAEDKGGEKDEKNKDGDEKKKDAGEEKSGLDAANEGDEKKEEGKEETPQVAAKLYRKIFLKKDKDRNFTPDPEAQKEIQVIKAWIEKEAAKVKTAWSAAAIPVGVTLTKAGAAAGTLVAPGIGTAIGAAAGAVAGALVSILGIGKKKHHLMEEKAKLLDNVDALIQHPEVIHELYDYIVTLDPDFSTIAAKIDEAAAELSKSEKKKAEYDKKKKAREDKKAGKEPPKESGLEKAGEKAHHGAEKVEGAEAGLEVGAAGAEAAGHAVHVLESVAPVLETTAHVAAGAAAVLNTFVTAVDAKAWSEKAKKYNELKAKMQGPAS